MPLTKAIFCKWFWRLQTVNKATDIVRGWASLHGQRTASVSQFLFYSVICDQERMSGWASSPPNDKFFLCHSFFRLFSAWRCRQSKCTYNFRNVSFLGQRKQDKGSCKSHESISALCVCRKEWLSQPVTIISQVTEAITAVDVGIKSRTSPMATTNRRDSSLLRSWHLFPPSLPLLSWAAIPSRGQV